MEKYGEYSRAPRKWYPKEAPRVTFWKVPLVGRLIGSIRMCEYTGHPGPTSSRLWRFTPSHRLITFHNTSSVHVFSSKNIECFQAPIDQNHGLSFKMSLNILDPNLTQGKPFFLSSWVAYQYGTRYIPAPFPSRFAAPETLSRSNLPRHISSGAMVSVFCTGNHRKAMPSFHIATPNHGISR